MYSDFKGCNNHRDLHSFPTRRSSDLDFCIPNNLVKSQICSMYMMVSLICFNGICFSVKRKRGIVNSSGNSRSEEHTSELQSRGHLVCRLLLEKKNQYCADNRSNHVDS